MWWMLLIGLFVLVILLVLWMPLRLYINSDVGRYEVSWGRLAWINLHIGGEELTGQWGVLGWRREFDLIRELAKRSQPAAKKPSPSRSAKAPKRRINRLPLRLLRIARSFRVRSFHLDMDTGDVVQNAYLYPVLAAIEHRGPDVHVNYDGRVSVHLWMENRLIRMVRAFLLL